MKALRALLLLLFIFLAASPVWAAFSLTQKSSSFFPVYMTFSSSDYNQKPTFVDLDNDGDKDLVVGYHDGSLKYLQNTGTASSPAWVVDDYKFSGISVTSYAAPAFADLDGDLDYDLIIGDLYGNLKYYKNVGSRTYPIWSYESTMFSGIDVGNYSSPTFADLDNDGDLDMTVGESSTLKYYKNTGTAANPVWTLDPAAFSFVTPRTNNSPIYTDLDSDGDMDLIVAAQGRIDSYQNTGNASSPSWNQHSAFVSGINAYTGGNNYGAAVADLDDDNDYDFLLGGESLDFYLNSGNTGSPSWVNSPPYVTGFDVGWGCAPALADINNDGLQDIVIGNNSGSINCFINKGSSSLPVWRIDDSKVATIDVGSVSAPALADMDADGDFDMVIGELYGGLKYYKNIGSKASPIWSPDNDIFVGVDVGNYSSPTLADLDSDGDLDLVIGRSSGQPVYYKNIGVPSSPTWEVDTTLFASIYSGRKPFFSDLDGDGDLDLVMGSSYELDYYENTGTTTAPCFTRDYSAFSIYNSEPAPAFADVDGDGKAELILGEYYGTLACYDLTYSDLTGPTINTPAYEIISTTGKYTLGWNPASDSSGIAAYELQESAGYGSYTTLSSTITSTSYEVTGKTYGIYYYRVRARDGVGNWGAYSSTFCTVTVAATTEAELAIAPSDVILSSGDRAVESGDLVVLDITVHNWGAKDASALLKVYVGAKDSAHLIGSTYIYPYRLSSSTGYIYWYTTGLAGPQNIYVVLESISPSDGDASNNEVVKTINVVNMFRSTFCYPNPFKPGEQSTRLVYKLINDGNTHLFIFDINGKIVYRKLYWSGEAGGSYGINEVEWNGASDYGNWVDNGLYIYKILNDAKKVLATGKILVLR